MKILHFSKACLFSFLTILYSTGLATSSCLESEKALDLLETAEDFLSKAEDSYPSCSDDANSTNESVCNGKKTLAYIEISRKLISDVRQNFTTCPTVVVKYVSEKDCSEILESGHIESGVYTIWLSDSNTTGMPLQVYCDMETDYGGWTLIQRRGEFSQEVPQEFYQDWNTYKKGFGNISEEFYLGNQNIFVLCRGGCKIRFDLEDENGHKAYAVYENFNLTGDNYTLHISDYSGDAGDAMQHHNLFDFSTFDHGYKYKAWECHGGWWYNDDNHALLNGMYLPEEKSIRTVHWRDWRRLDNLASVEIKVKPR